MVAREEEDEAPLFPHALCFISSVGLRASTLAVWVGILFTQAAWESYLLRGQEEYNRVLGK